MFKLSVRSVLAFLATLACVATLVWFALDRLLPAPPARITIATGAPGGAFEFYARKYRDVLAHSHVRLEIRPSEGTSENLELLSDSKSRVDVAFVQGGVSNSRESPGLESLGRIDYLVFFVFCRASDSFTDLTELKGKRIAIGPPGSGTNIVASRILSANGVNFETATLLPLAGQQAVDALAGGRADVLILGNALDAPIVQSLLHDPGVRLVNLPRAKALARRFAYLSRLELPAGVVDLQDNIPPGDVNMIGTTVSVLVRDDVHPEIVGLLARALEEVHRDPGVLHAYGEFPTESDPDFPIAESALDFYKNGPSFLHRYLPFWVVSYVKRLLAILLTVIAIVVPVFSYAPKIYLWFLGRHMTRVYRDLRALEAEMCRDLPMSRLVECRADLERIERLAGALPQRHSNLFFELRAHIDLVCGRLDAALAETRALSVPARYRR